MERRRKRSHRIRKVKLRHGEAIVIDGLPNRSIVSVRIAESAKVRVIRIDKSESTSQ